MIDTAHVFFRVAAAGGLGALIGLERESRNQLAGMRTHALVAAGAGLWRVALAGAAVTLVVLVLLRPVRTRLLTLTASRYMFEVEYERGHGTLGPVLETIGDVGGSVDDLSVDDETEGIRRLELDVHIQDADDLREAARIVSNRPEVVRCTVHRK